MSIERYLRIVRETSQAKQVIKESKKPVVKEEVKVENPYRSTEQVLGIVQRMMEDARVPQKPRQGPLRPQTGAGKHKDKKKDQKQGKTKHKAKELDEGRFGRGRDDQFSLGGRMPRTDRIDRDSSSGQDAQQRMERKLKQQTIDRLLDKGFKVDALNGKSLPELIQMLREGIPYSYGFVPGRKKPNATTRHLRDYPVSDKDVAKPVKKPEKKKPEQGVAEGSLETDNMVSHIGQVIKSIYPRGGDKNTYMKLVAQEMPRIVRANPKLFRRAFGIAYDRFFHIDQDDDFDYTDYSMRQGERGMEEATGDNKFDTMMGNIKKSAPVSVTGYVAVEYASENKSDRIKGATLKGKPMPSSVDRDDLDGEIDFEPDEIERHLIKIGRDNGWSMIDPGHGRGYSELFFDTNANYTSDNQSILAKNIVNTVNQINKFFSGLNSSLQSTGLPGYRVAVWQEISSSNGQKIGDIDQIKQIALTKVVNSPNDPGELIGKAILQELPAVEQDEYDDFTPEDFAYARKIAKIYITKGERAGLEAQISNRRMDHVSDLIDELLSLSGAQKYRTLKLDDLDEQGVAEEKQKGVDGKACWKGYKRMGTKKKGGRTVDNCVKMESISEGILKSFGLMEKSPPGFKGTVKAMKKHPELTKGKTKDGKEKNPWALAWHMKNKGYKSHKKADGSDKD